MERLCVGVQQPMSLISPPLSEKTPLASLDGWTLLLKCPRCGDRTKPVSALYAVVDRCRPIGTILPRLSCDACKSKPTRLLGVNTWVAKFDREPATEDLSFLLPKPEAEAA
jgi:hypothetical protein